MRTGGKGAAVSKYSGKQIMQEQEGWRGYINHDLQQD